MRMLECQPNDTGEKIWINPQNVVLVKRNKDRPLYSTIVMVDGTKLNIEASPVIITMAIDTALSESKRPA
jgi:hypothetical protein